MRSWMLAAIGIAALFDARAGAAQTQREDEPRAVPTDPSAPEQHFENALEDYRAGRYRAAIQGLNAAIVLDPESKDLFYNLALVYEKLGELDPAIVALGRYIELERDPAEVKRAGQTIARLRGAKAELAMAQRAQPTPAPPPSPPPASPRAAPTPNAQRVDEWILGGTALSAAAAVVGIVFGARALGLASDEGSATREKREKEADESARIANIALSTSVLAASGTALLWYLRADEACSGTAALGVSVHGTF